VRPLRLGDVEQFEVVQQLAGAAIDAEGAQADRSTARMLKMLLPTTLPTAMSRSPLSAATTEVATSGQRGAAAPRS
jgi:hypothetical protein